MNYYLFTLGCQMNKSDAERIQTILENLGYQKTDQEEKANLIMVIACSVRQSAIDRIYGKVRLWNKMKQKNPLVTVLTGCVLEKDRKKLAKNFDLIFEIQDLPKLPSLIQNLPSKLTVSCLPSKDYFQIHPQYNSSFQAYLPIMTGCNNFCTYCVVPYTRGPETSRPEKEIIQEFKNLIKRGYKEITLLGQNVNSYGRGYSQSNYSNKPFIQLLQKLNNIKSDFRLRFITNHPQDMTDDLIEELPKLDKITPYLHLPLQSGDDKILAKMNRHYTSQDYLKQVNKIRKTLPGVAISTDIIVGFPGETEEQFQNTARMMKKIKFDMAYIAQYSPRPQTAASKLKDDIPKLEKQRREKELTRILEKTALENNKKLIGTIQKILVEKKLKNNQYLGKTATFKTTKVLSNKNIIGQFIKAKITKANSFGLEGKLVK